MTYKVKFSITIPMHDWDTRTIKLSRKFPEYVCGIRVTKQMMKELILAEYPDSSVGIISITEE
tara:strand:- start:471 stop:659 length:189 start_codon:yes stop_codon:yes gene_type:complete